jgi:menaquinone-dependent protoporphyrinogen oxidase
LKRVLVAYGSKMGGTAGIAAKVAEILSERGCEVTLRPAGQAKIAEGYDAAVIGSALYANRWRKEAVSLLKRLRRAGGIPVWLFHSGPLGDERADDPQPVPKTVASLADALGAEDVVTFPGRLPVDATGFIAKAMVRNGKGGDWRDFEQIGAWAAMIADSLER